MAMNELSNGRKMSQSFDLTPETRSGTTDHTLPEPAFAGVFEVDPEGGDRRGLGVVQLDAEELVELGEGELVQTEPQNPLGVLWGGEQKRLEAHCSADTGS